MSLLLKVSVYVLMCILRIYSPSTVFFLMKGGVFMKKAQLTSLQRRWLLNYYHRHILTANQIKKTYGWTIDELSLVHPKTTEHYFIKCPKCSGHSIAMSKHYGSHNVPLVEAVCRECGTRAIGKDSIEAMVRWNKEQVIFTH